MSLSALDNIVWHSLAGPQERFSAGGKTARRFARGFGPLCGFADPQRPGLGELEPHCDVGEHVFCGRWDSAAPDGWRIDMEVPAEQMVWGGGTPEDEEVAANGGDSGGENPGAIVRLGARDVPQMLELVALTQPGPFGQRTIELGEYFGIYEEGALVAMAGERMEAASLREISAVCTHPDLQGRGLARRLMHLLIRRQRRRGLVPFLHVMQYNTRAIAMYERMGFRRHRQWVLRVVCRT